MEARQSSGIESELLFDLDLVGGATVGLAVAVPRARNVMLRAVTLTKYD